MAKTESFQKLASSFIFLGVRDYRAARVLLIHGLLDTGCINAAYAIEKYLKALLALKRQSSKRRHLEPALLAQIYYQYPHLKERLDEDFLKFLTRTYKLRYALTKSQNFKLVINQYRCLIALDVTVKFLNDSIVVTDQSGNRLDTVLDQEIKRGRKDILQLNAALDENAAKEISNSQNLVYEFAIGKNGEHVSVEYKTEKLNVAGDFCKTPELDPKKAKFRLTMG